MFLTGREPQSRANTCRQPNGQQKPCRESQSAVLSSTNVPAAAPSGQCLELSCLPSHQFSSVSPLDRNQAHGADYPSLRPWSRQQTYPRVFGRHPATYSVRHPSKTDLLTGCPATGSALRRDGVGSIHSNDRLAIYPGWSRRDRITLDGDATIDACGHQLHAWSDDQPRSGIHQASVRDIHN